MSNTPTFSCFFFRSDRLQQEFYVRKHKRLLPKFHRAFANALNWLVLCMVWLNGQLAGHSVVEYTITSNQDCAATPPTPQTPFGHIRALIWSGVRGNIARGNIARSDL